VASEPGPTAVADAVLRDGATIVYVPTLVLDPDAAASAIVDGLAAAGSRRPVAAVFLTGAAPPRALREASIPTYDFPEDAARALAAAARHRAARAQPPSPPAEVHPPPRRDEAAAVVARALASSEEWLAPGAVADLARCYDLPLIAARLARTPRDAAAELGGPVALKGVAPGLLRKTDVGAVRLGLCGPTAVLRAARDMKHALRERGHASPEFLVQRMAAPGVELLVGVSTDPQFGPVIARAAGGTAVELLADKAVRLGPLTERDVYEMPRSLATFPLLAGHRGAPRAPIGSLQGP
jgi:acetate---CoA ligase (ADP-forming)